MDWLIENDSPVARRSQEEREKTGGNRGNGEDSNTNQRHVRAGTEQKLGSSVIRLEYYIHRIVWVAFFLLGATAQSELWPSKQSASIRITWWGSWQPAVSFSNAQPWWHKVLSGHNVIKLGVRVTYVVTCKAFWQLEWFQPCCHLSYTPSGNVTCSFGASSTTSEADFPVSEHFSFYGVRLLNPRLIPNLEDQNIPLCLAHTLDLSGMDGPTSSYATAGIALGVSGALKPHHHNKVEILSVGYKLPNSCKYMV
jgi:hypothetical protein